MTTKKSDTMKFLEGLTGGPLTLKELISSIRVGEEMTQKDFAQKLGISVQHLCNIEKGLKVVSPARAVKFAKILGYSEQQFLRLALQDEISRSGIQYEVSVTPIKLSFLRKKKVLKERRAKEHVISSVEASLVRSARAS